MSSTDESGISDEVMLTYLWCTFGVVIQIFNLFGIVTNIINIICFCRIGFDESVNISLLGLAVSDLGSLLMMTLTCIGFTPAMTFADLSFIPQEVAFAASAITHTTFTRGSSCFTALITLERCLCITAPLKVKNLITPRRTSVISICVFVVFFSSDAPNLYVNRLGLKFVPSRNRTLLGIVGTRDRETVERISFIINTFSIPVGAFVIIVVCTTILSVQLRRSAKWREQTLTNLRNDKVTLKNYRVAKMVVMIASMFIICFIPNSTATLAIAFVPEMSLLGKYVKVSLIFGGFGYLMESINSSMNIFFYHHMSSHYRNTFRKTCCSIKT